MLLTMESQNSLKLEMSSLSGPGHSGAGQEPLNIRRAPTGSDLGSLEFTSLGSGKNIPQRNDSLSRLRLVSLSAHFFLRLTHDRFRFVFLLTSVSWSGVIFRWACTAPIMRTMSRGIMVMVNILFIRLQQTGNNLAGHCLYILSSR